MINQQPRTYDRLLVNVREAAAMLSISPRKLWDLTKRGDVSSVRIDRRVLYYVDDLRKSITKWKGGSTDDVA